MTEILVYFIFSEDVGNDDGYQGGENGADENDADDKDVDDDYNEADACRAIMKKSLTGLKFDGYASDKKDKVSTHYRYETGTGDNMIEYLIGHVYHVRVSHGPNFHGQNYSN